MALWILLCLDRSKKLWSIYCMLIAYINQVIALRCWRQWLSTLFRWGNWGPQLRQLDQMVHVVVGSKTHSLCSTENDLTSSLISLVRKREISVPVQHGQVATTALRLESFSYMFHAQQQSMFFFSRESTKIIWQCRFRSKKGRSVAALTWLTP